MLRACKPPEIGWERGADWLFWREVSLRLISVFCWPWVCHVLLLHCGVKGGRLARKSLVPEMGA